MERPTTRGGFSLGGLIAIILALALLSAVLFPAVSGSVRAANMTAVASRGKGIYVAMIGANTEREPLGLPPVWPSDESEFNFTNSTDYFRYIYDGSASGRQTGRRAFSASTIRDWPVPVCPSGRKGR